MKYYQDEERMHTTSLVFRCRGPRLFASWLQELMLKISQKMGGLPSELQPVLKKSPGTSF